MKLKTLKDIWFNSEDAIKVETHVLLDKIKAEAIKWVKFYKTSYHWEQMVAVKFMEFFNITEEELK